MSYSVRDAKAELEGLLKGTSLNRIRNVNGAMYRAARQLLADVSPLETVVITELAVPISNDLYDYPAPPDLKEDGVIDIRPQISRVGLPSIEQKFNAEFDKTKDIGSPNAEFTIQVNNGVRSLRIKAAYQASPVFITNADVSGAGGDAVWTGTNMTGIATDSLNYFFGSGSISGNSTLAAFPGNASFNGALNNPVDLSDHLLQSTLYLLVYIPVASSLNSVTFAWGTDSSNYWTSTATTTQQATEFQNGWNLVSFDWASATEVGTPDAADINYVQVTFTLNAATGSNGFKINGVRSSMGRYHEIEYYSKFLFRNASTGALQEKITSTDDSEIINLDTTTYNMFIDQCLIQMVRQSSTLGDVLDMNSLVQTYESEVAKYKSRIKSQKKKTGSAYYRVRKPIFQFSPFRRT